MSGVRSPVRLKFGVAPVTVYTKPSGCGGMCIFCPSAKGLPKSYIYNSDTCFAKKTNYSPREQLLQSLKNIKLHKSCMSNDIPLEIIVLGGSFSSLSKTYRGAFIAEIYDLLSSENKIYVDGLLINARCSVLTVESRPDQISEEECKFLRNIGVSKVEIGVQHTCNEVLRRSDRGHSQEQIILATELLKDSGFKVGYHVMLGLPGTTKEKDIHMLEKTIWEDEYNPDYLKIYPCELLVDRSLQPALHKLYDSGKWFPPNQQYCLEILDRAAPLFPEHVRISRVQRQFDSDDVLKGVKTRLREKIKTPIRDIRAREAGITLSQENTLVDFGQASFRSYGNTKDRFFEIYLGSSDVLLAMARLRFSTNLGPVLREIKVFGYAASVGDTGQVQGRGLGTSLLLAIENLVAQAGHSIMFINAAVGARSFFIKNGYVLNSDDYLEKSINENMPNKLIQKDF